MSSISGVSGQNNAWANASTQRSQMQAKMFAKVDADSSGGVDKTELQTMLADISKKAGTTLDADKLFSTVDSNADGSLSSEELATGMQSVMPPPPSTMDFVQSRNSTSETDDLFSKVDANSDGSVDATEMTAFTDKMKAETGRDIPTSFAELDTDSDSKLSQAEFDVGRPTGGPKGAQNTSNSGGVEGAGGPPPPGGPGGAQPASGASGADSATYDALDTNEDGSVSELERLAGALKDFVSASDADPSTSNSNDSILKLAKQIYEQISAGVSTQSISTLDATA